MKNLAKFCFCSCAIFFTGMNFHIHAQSHISTQAHQEAINMVVPASLESDFDKSFFTIGKDGFLVKWTSDDQGEHYQISDMEIRMAAVSPNGKEIAVYETDGGSINRVSVWNWDTLSRKFARRFSDSITSLSYSSKGTFIIAGTATVDGAVFIRANDGAVVEPDEEGAGVQARLVSGLCEHAGQHRAGRTLAVRAGHVDEFQLPLGVAHFVQKRADALETGDTALPADGMDIMQRFVKRHVNYLLLISIRISPAARAWQR